MLIGLVLILQLLVLVVPAAGANEFARSSTELEVLQQNIRILKQELVSGRKQEDALTADLDRAEQKLSRLNSEIRMQTVLRDALNQDISILERRAGELEHQRIDATSQLGSLLRSMYIMGRQSGLRMLVNQQDPHIAARRLTMFRYVTSAKNQQLQNLAGLYAQINRNRALTDEKRQDLEITISELEQHHLDLKVHEGLRAEQLAAVRRSLTADESKIELYKEREQALKLLLAELMRTPRSASEKPSKQTAESDNPEPVVVPERASESTPRSPPKTRQLLAGFENNRGKLSLPLEADIRAKFGQKKQESGLRWEGVLFNSRNGQSVRSIYPGQVVFSDWFRGYGQLMVVDHGQGYMSLYGHNQALQADVGDVVQAQQVIAMASEAGQNPSPGLYFEIRHNGNPDDPLKWCR